MYILKTETSSAEEVSSSAEVSTTEMALKCWRGAFVNMVPGGAIQKMRLWECPEGSARCVKMHCSMDEAALRALQLDHVPPGTKSLTQTSKGCLLATDKCELPDETFMGVSFKSLQKYCKVTCCDGNACNGTLGLRSVGTVAAMMAFFAAVFFVHWH
uniref:Protein quiver n=1 Tax=Globodera rostochiensis TaxID=31243 RepID=A0A914H7S2_GLORO